MVRLSRSLTLLILFGSGCDGFTAGSDSARTYVKTGKILVLGDSLAVSPSSAEGFPSRLQRRLQGAGLSWTVVNAGVRGDTTAGGLRRIDRLLTVERPNVLILALGANDGLRVGDVTRMSRNLEEIIVRAKTQHVRVLLCGMELPPIGLFGYGRAFQDAFSALAEKHDLAFVPFLLEGVAMNGAMNGDDGIHPNVAGAERIADTVWRYLAPLLEENR